MPEPFDETQDRPLGQRILGAQVSTLFRNGRVLLPFYFLNVLFVSLAQGDGVEPWIRWSWLSAQALFSAQRAWTLRSFFRDEQSGFQTPPRSWALHSFWGNLAGGLLWGAWILAWREAVPFSLLAVECVLLGSVTVVAFSPFLPSFYAFCLPLTAAYLTAFFTTPPSAHPMGFGGIPFMLLLSFLAHLMNRNLVENIRLRFENQDLASGLSAAKAKAEQALTAKNRFLAAASHDLRQPLHAQGLFLHALLSDRSASPKRGILHKLRATHLALGGLLDALLNLSLAESGALKPQPRPFPLKPLFAKLRDEFTPLAHRKGLALSCTSPSAWTFTDPELLERVLRNLLSNAVRHTKKGKVRLVCRPQKKFLALEVWDTGPGIPPEERENIFQEFYQLKNPERDRAKGLGLGLAIVRSLCQALGHPLRLASTPQLKRGSLFTVEVPKATPVKRGKVGRTLERKSRFQGQVVLVLDDESEIRQGLEGLLKAWGLVPLCASTTDGALALIQRKVRPQALLCDYRLRQGETGGAAVRRIRELLKTNLPAALITGDTSTEPVKEAKALGTPLLLKPVNPAKLRSTLEDLLRG